MRFDVEITENILKYINRNRLGCITQIATGAGTTRITAAKHLERLKNEGVLEEKPFGKFRIFYKR